MRICLRCRTDMTKTYFHGILADVCGNCGGVWIDGGDELRCLRSGRSMPVPHLHALLEAETKAEAGRKVEHPGSCPCCSGKIVYFTEDSLRLDRCETCGGIFFDEGELDNTVKSRYKKKSIWRRLLKLLFPGMSLVMFGCSTPTTMTLVPDGRGGYTASVNRRGVYEGSIKTSEGAEITVTMDTQKTSLLEDYVKAPVKAVDAFARGLGSKLGSD